MNPRPQFQAAGYRPAGKLAGKSALITGGDSGIGRAVAIIYARDGANVAIAYLPFEQSDAEETQKNVEAVGQRCLLLPGDLTEPKFLPGRSGKDCSGIRSLDLLVNNAAHQSRKKTVEEITYEEWERTFSTNTTAFFRLVRAAIPHLKPGSAVIATSSITGLALDYSSTKGAINAFVKALAQNLLILEIGVDALSRGLDCPRPRLD